MAQAHAEVDPAARAFFAPGRANLLGAHMDYNGGSVLPVALSRGTCALFVPRGDSLLRLESTQFPGEVVETSLAELRPRRTDGWSAYLEGGLYVAMREWGECGGFDIYLDADLPMAKGLSSSASVESVAVYAVSRLHDLDPPPDLMIRLAHAAETEYVGVRCGILDQTAIFLAQEDSALLFDCTELTREHLPLRADQAVIAVADSGVARQLAKSAFNQRVAECTQALAFFQQRLPGMTCLRDLTAEQLQEFGGGLETELRMRAQHVVSEKLRTDAGADALRRGDLVAFGHAMSGAHISLRDLYEVSTPELDALVESAWSLPGCYGGRLTGAGFGGCIAAVVAPDAFDDFARELPRLYRHATGSETEVLGFSPAGGPVEWQVPESVRSQRQP